MQLWENSFVFWILLQIASNGDKIKMRVMIFEFGYWGKLYDEQGIY